MYHYRWLLNRVDGFKQHPQLTLENVIAEVYWELEVRDDSDMSVHYIRAMTKLADPTPGDFTDYIDMNHMDVLSMVWAQEGGREVIEQRAKQELDELRDPTTKLQTLAPHWLNDCCPDGKNIDQQGATSTSN
jgi:hypothetical protein